MKKITFFAIITLIVSFLGSCKKEKINPYEGRVVAEGYVRQMGLKQGIVPNAQVILYEVKTSGELFAPIYFIPIDTAITNADGYYYIDTPVDEKQSIFELGTSAKDYSKEYKSLGDPNTNFLDPNKVGLGKNVKARHDIGLRPYSWVKVHVKKTNIKDSTVIGISGSWASSTLDAVSFDELLVNETFVRKILGNDSTKLSYILVNGFKYISKETPNKFAATHDTITFNINY